MAWLSQNWLWLVLGVAFLSRHLLGHGTHGGHRSADHGLRPQNDKGLQGRLAPARVRAEGREPMRRPDR